MKRRTFLRNAAVATAAANPAATAAANSAATGAADASAGSPQAAKAPAAAGAAEPTLLETLEVAPVWAGHSVGFALLTRGKDQFIGFYDAERRMTIGKRALTDKKWSFAILPETVKWDSHNYIAMAADDDGFLHISGNLHVNPLVYFRSTKPLDISTLERVPGGMTGRDEARATYPVFFRGPGGRLYFAYRDGSSGNGNQIYNVWDGKTKTWTRVMDKPFTDGEGERNAYLSQPQLGPDGYFHIAWVWRESPDASTNHDPSYARSKDLIHWENSAGKPFALPITLKTGEVIDPVPVGGGIINGNLRIGFDAQKRPVLTYHKYDAKGNLQIYNARREHAEWKIVQVSPNWEYRWDFKGGGSIPFEVSPGGVSVAPDGRLQQTWSHKKFGSGIWYSDPETLQVVERAPSKPAYPASLTKVQGSFPGLEIRWAGDSGKSGEKGVRYALRWETMGAYRDRPRPPEETPPPQPLRLVKLRDNG